MSANQIKSGVDQIMCKNCLEQFQKAKTPTTNLVKLLTGNSAQTPPLRSVKHKQKVKLFQINLQEKKFMWLSA